MKYDFLVLGASGMQGRIATREFIESGFSVCLADIWKGGGAEKNMERAKDKATFEFCDLRDENSVYNLIKNSGATVVLNCAEGDWNLNAYRAALKAKANILDLGSDIAMTKEQMAMGPFFKQDNIIAITGCGSTPGVNNIMLNFAVKDLDHVDTIEAGFVWDSNIKKFVVPFSIESILDEITMPAPVIENHEWSTKQPLENIKVRKFKGIGKQKYFPVVHPETYTFLVNYEKEGLRNMTFYAGFPDHSLDQLVSFVELGLGSTEPIEIDGKKVRPVDALTQSLRKLKIPEGYTEKENLWVEVKGTKDGEEKAILMECIVPTLPGWEDAGCNIDTGITAAIMAKMVKDGRVTTKGSYTPAMVIPEVPFFKELKKRKMKVHKNGVLIN